MSDTETKSRRRATEAESSAATVQAAAPPPVLLPAAHRRRFRFFPLLITFAVIAVAVVLGQAMWNVYMGAP